MAVQVMSKAENPLGLTASELDRALEVHRRSIVIDGSNVAIVNPWLERPLAEQFFDKMIEGEVTASNVTVPQDVDAGIALSAKQLVMHQRWIESSPDKAILVRKTADLERAKRERKAAIIFGPQNATLLEDSLEAVRFFHGLGLRIMQLTYNVRNLLGDGCMETANAGLSEFGRAVVREMNELGIVVDLSHCGDRTTLEATEVSTKPPIFSHANPRAVCKHRRNRTDQQIEALAAKGGVICLTPYNPFVRLREEGVVPTLNDFLRHVEYAVKLVGVDHVGIGTDVNENNETRRIWYREAHPEVVGSTEFHNYPAGFDGDLRKYATLTMALVAGGYSDEDISKMLGGNLLRVFRAVWG